MKNNIEKFRKEQNASFAKNVIMLAGAQIAVKVLGLIYKIIIVNVPGFGNEGNGFYSTGYQLYMVLLAISSIGIPNVVSKMVSERVALGDYRGAHKVFRTSMFLISMLGLILSLFMFIFARTISLLLFKTEGVAYTMMALSPAVFFVSSNSVLRGYFTGLGSLKSTSISEIIEQLFNCILSILFVYMMMGKSTAIMAAAGNLSTTVAVLISLGYMTSHYLLRRKFIKEQCKNQTADIRANKTSSLTKNIILLALPASFASLVSTLSGNIDSITVSTYTGNVEAYGLISKTETLTHLPLALGATLFMAMVPVISSKIATDDRQGAIKQLTDTLFLNNIVIFPCTAGFIILADPLLKLLFPAVSDGATILKLQTVAMLFASVTFVLNGAFYGLGKQKFPAIILLFGAILKLILNIVVLKIFDLGVEFAVIATIVYQALVTLAEWIILKKYLPFKMDVRKQFTKPLFATVVMSGMVLLSYNMFIVKLNNTISTLASIVFGAIVYFIVLAMLKTLDEDDLLALPMGSKIVTIMKKFKLIK